MNPNFVHEYSLTRNQPNWWILYESKLHDFPLHCNNNNSKKGRIYYWNPHYYICKLCATEENAHDSDTQDTRNELETHTYTHIHWIETSSQIFDLILMKIASIPMSARVASIWTNDSITNDDLFYLTLAHILFTALLLFLLLLFCCCVSFFFFFFLALAFVHITTFSISLILHLNFLVCITLSRSHWRWHTDNWRTSKWDMNKTMKTRALIKTQ